MSKAGEAQVSSRPNIRMEYAVLRLILGHTLKCIPLAILGDPVYQGPAKANLPTEREPLGGAENQGSQK